MPGLVALVTRQYDKRIAENITRMVEVMEHESFYKTEIFKRDGFPFVAGRVHLNVVNTERQPIFNEDRTILIMMDGELHSREGIREKLISAGHIIKTDDDAELLLHLYEELGEDFANDLNGWFVAVIHDTLRNQTIIVNDSLGLCPAYYVQDNGTLIIASEVKCLLEYNRLSYTVSKRGIAEYLHYGGVLNDATMFDQIFRLPPACVWIYRDGVISKKKYFDISRESQEDAVDTRDFLENAAQIFTNILPRYLRGNNIGFSLTGGWDTRAIFAAMTRMGRRVPCYTWCGPYRDSIDVKLANRLIKAWEQPITIFRINENFFNDFKHYAYKTIYVTDGQADIFTSHELYFNEMTREVSPVRLTGKHGSEIASRLFIPSRKQIDRRILSNDINALNQDVLSFDSLASIIGGIRWMWPAGFLSAERSQLVVRTPYSDRDFVKYLHKASFGMIKGRKIQKTVTLLNDPISALIPSDKGDYIKTDNFLVNARLSLVSLVFKMLATFDRAYLHPDIPHIFTVADPLMKYAKLEKLFLGYCNLVAYRIWIKNEMRNFVVDLLLDKRTLSRPYLNPDFVKKMTSAHFGNRANYMHEIGKIVSLEIWHRLFIDRESVYNLGIKSR